MAAATMVAVVGTGTNSMSGGGGGSGYISSILTDAETIAGNVAMPTHDGTPTMTGNTGNGCARITLLKDEFTYDYTGNYREFIAPKTGYYKLETWGASGGNTDSSYIGGKGGYSTGIIQLQKGEKLYIHVGGTTTTTAGGYNGGGASLAYRGGGGATHIATKNGLLKSLSSSKDSILIVAGGGGGAAHTGDGGAGGGTSGINGESASDTYGRGGTQTAAGYNAGFGYGGKDYRHGGGGGGGYYGGGGRR